MLYPAWRELGREDADADARSEHQEMKEALVILSRTEPGQPEFEQRFWRGRPRDCAPVGLLSASAPASWE